MDRSIPPISKEQPVFIFPAFERRTLSNGMKVLFVHDRHRLLPKFAKETKLEP